MVGSLVSVYTASFSEPEFCVADDIAFLQSHTKASQGPTCPLNGLNSGDCLGDAMTPTVFRLVSCCA